MTLEEVKTELGDNNLSYSKVGFPAMANIMKFVNVKLEMDRNTFDYYYEIDVDELINSDMPSDELDTLKNQGWSFSENNKTLILYLKN